MNERVQGTRADDQGPVLMNQWLARRAAVSGAPCGRRLVRNKKALC